MKKSFSSLALAAVLLLSANLAHGQVSNLAADFFNELTGGTDLDSTIVTTMGNEYRLQIRHLDQAGQTLYELEGAGDTLWVGMTSLGNLLISRRGDHDYIEVFRIDTSANRVVRRCDTTEEVVLRVQGGRYASYPYVQAALNWAEEHHRPAAYEVPSRLAPSTTPLYVFRSTEFTAAGKVVSHGFELETRWLIVPSAETASQTKGYIVADTQAWLVMHPPLLEAALLSPLSRSEKAQLREHLRKLRRARRR